jgi:transposase
MGEGPIEKLSGTVEIDETYVGGKARYPRSMDNKTMVLGAIEREGRVVFRVEGKRPATRKTLHKSVKDVVADNAEAIYTDQHHGYQGIADRNTRHETVSHHQEEWVRGDVSTQSIESVWSLLDRSIIGSFHQLSTKHLPAYLDEISYRFNNRENAYLFRDTLIALVTADPLQYRELTAD